jgi:hypothetical protein
MKIGGGIKTGAALSAHGAAAKWRQRGISVAARNGENQGWRSISIGGVKLNVGGGVSISAMSAQ